MNPLELIPPEVSPPSGPTPSQELPLGAESTPSPGSLPPLHQHSVEERLACLENIFNSAPVGLCFLDLDSRYLEANESLAQISGLPLSSLLGHTMQEVLPAVAKQVADRLDPAVAAQGPAQIKMFVEKPSRLGDQLPPEKFVYLRSSRPMHDANGALIGFSVAITDITDRERAEDALRESEENYRHTVELSPHIPWAADAEGNMNYISSRYTTLTGFNVIESSEAARFGTIHVEDRDATLAAWRSSVKTGNPYDIDHRIHCAGGQSLWVRSRAFPRRDADGKIVKWYGTIEDIHERKLLDQALEIKTARLEEATARLASLVREDHLTGLANRRHFDDALQQEAARARRSGHPLALIMIDVDHFKRFNDTYGHPAGDECLRSVARILGKILRRQGDLAARYGGEEFVILLPDTPEEGALSIAQHAQANVRELAIPHLGSNSGILTISLGVASGETFADGYQPSDLIQSADLALYAAKAAGRDRIIMASTLARAIQEVNLPSQKEPATL